MKRNGPKTISQAQSTKRGQKPSPSDPQTSGLPGHKKNLEINSKKKRENGCLANTIFPSSLGTVLKALKGHISKV
jgi:hypothetical protein